uniref:Uncharacterized protein n=1 Tax=Anguilla anguilla TaxID=7936 RepID=A0A0E9UZC0_ANGAN
MYHNEWNTYKSTHDLEHSSKPGLHQSFVSASSYHQIASQ